MKVKGSFLHDEPALRVSFGWDAHGNLVKDMDRAGLSRAVVVCGRSLAKSGSELELLREALGPRLAGIHPGARPHSPVPQVIETSRFLRDAGADAIIAVGGGSAIVTARAASILLAEGEDVAALATSVTAEGRMISPRLRAPKLPQFVIPTTPTTAIVKAGSAIYDEVAGKRRALFDPKTRSQAVYVHPALLAPVPKQVFVSAGLNTLCMAVEGLIATKGDPLADAQLTHALRLAADGLAQLNGPEAGQARTDLIFAAILCGRATDSTNGGLTTALGHAIGVRHHVENGIVNAVVLPSVLEFNADAAAGDLRKVERALGLAAAGSARESALVIGRHLVELFDALGVPRTLGELGVPAEARPALAQLVTEDWFLRGNPRPVGDATEVERVMTTLW